MKFVGPATLEPSCESFARLFKGGAVEGAEPSSLVGASEKLKAAFLFCKAFFFVPRVAKKKASETLVLTSNRGVIQAKRHRRFL